MTNNSWEPIPDLDQSTKPQDTWAFPNPPYSGMTLRDYFAAKAMQSYIQHPSADRGRPGQIAEWAYKTADEMLLRRPK